MMSDDLPAPAARPTSVTNAVRLLYTTFCIGILRSMLEFQNLAQTAPLGTVVTTWIVVTAILLMLIYYVSQGRNWARITFLVLFALGAPFAVQPLFQSIADYPLSGTLGVVQMIGQLSALVLLFQNAANAWFRRRRTPPKGTIENVEF